MNEMESLIIALCAGCLLGTVFYGGLWWTIQKGTSASYPALWFFTSFWLRIGITVAGFYGIANGDWKSLLACLAGFVIARIIITRLTREIRHAN